MINEKETKEKYRKIGFITREEAAALVGIADCSSLKDRFIKKNVETITIQTSEGRPLTMFLKEDVELKIQRVKGIDSEDRNWGKMLHRICEVERRLTVLDNNISELINFKKSFE